MSKTLKKIKTITNIAVVTAAAYVLYRDIKEQYPKLSVIDFSPVNADNYYFKYKENKYLLGIRNDGSEPLTVKEAGLWINGKKYPCTFTSRDKKNEAEIRPYEIANISVMFDDFLYAILASDTKLPLCAMWYIKTEDKTVLKKTAFNTNKTKTLITGIFAEEGEKVLSTM